jgi:hypothetical protein
VPVPPERSNEDPMKIQITSNGNDESWLDIERQLNSNLHCRRREAELGLSGKVQGELLVQTRHRSAVAHELIIRRRSLWCRGGEQDVSTVVFEEASGGH